MTKRMAIFASGRGSNAEALYDAIKAGKINAEIVVLVSDIPDAPVLEKAEKWNIPAIIADRKQFSSKEEFEDFILDQIKPYQPDLIALAGFMRLLSGRFISHYENRIINIHPALLPSFKGLHDCFRYGSGNPCGIFGIGQSGSTNRNTGNTAGACQRRNDEPSLDAFGSGVQSALLSRL